MNLQERIKEFENEGWTYENEFKLATGKGNTLVQFMALTKDGYYKKIDKGRIGPAKQYMSDIDIEALKSSWGGVREGAGRKATGRKKRNLYITDEEYQALTKYLEELRNPGK
jgi:hypothetical protein